MRDFKGMKRQRGRNRGGGGGGKPQQHNANRAFESNGPDNLKIRGHAQHVYEKYQQLARDATSAGDRVLAENFLQHAEHYFRLLRTLQPNRPYTDFIAREGFNAGYDIDFEDESGAGEGDYSEMSGEGGEGQSSETGEGQSREGRWENRDNRQNDRQNDSGQNRDNRQNEQRQGDGRQDNRDRNFNGNGAGNNGNGPRRDRDRNFNRDRNDRYENRDGRDDRTFNRDQSGAQTQNGESQNRDGQNRDGQNRDGQNRDGQNRGGQNRDAQNRDTQNRDGQNRDGRWEGRSETDGDNNGDYQPRDRYARDDRGAREDRSDRNERRERTYEPRAERDPLPVVEPQAQPLTSAPAIEEAQAAAPRRRMLRSHDGEESHAPAFLQSTSTPAPAATAEDGESAPKRRGRPRKKVEEPASEEV